MSTLKISNVNPINTVSIAGLNPKARVIFGTGGCTLYSSTLEGWRQYVIDLAKEREFDVAHFDYTSLLEYFIETIQDGDVGTFIAITSDDIVFNVGM